MATFYRGYRPVLKGRNHKQSINTYTGTVGTYSNWDLMNPSHVLDGFPDRAVTPGAGAYPSDYFGSYIYTGRHHIAPMKAPGLGSRTEFARFDYLTYKGIVPIFTPGYGHALRETEYSNHTNYVYGGLLATRPLPTATVGHAVRYTSPINSFGSFGPYVHKGTTKAMPGTIGHTLDSDRVNEWVGVPSAKALA